MNINPNYVRVPEMGSANPDELFVCPYDPIHRVAAKRFPYHLMKCRKNWIGRSMSTCPFNARHLVPQPEFRHHVANCPDKCMIEMDIAFLHRKENQDGSYMKGCTDIPAYNKKTPSPTEDWDREILAADIRVGYNPDEEKEDVYRNLTGYKPSEKKEYYRRIGKVHFKTQEDIDTHVPGKSPEPKQPSHPQPTSQYQNGPISPQPDLATNQQMRLPKQLPKAAEVAAAAAAASQPNGRDSQKKGGRAIAANIFGPKEEATFDSSRTVPNLVSTPQADAETSYGSSSAFSRPLPGMGRGLIPGLGRGVLPGIGRGLLSLNNAIGLQARAMEPKVGMKQAVTSS